MCENYCYIYIYIHALQVRYKKVVTDKLLFHNIVSTCKHVVFE